MIKLQYYTILYGKQLPIMHGSWLYIEQYQYVNYTNVATKS
jgi:hypothetical protein